LGDKNICEGSVSIRYSLTLKGTPEPSTLDFDLVTVSKFYMKGRLRCEHEFLIPRKDTSYCAGFKTTEQISGRILGINKRPAASWKIPSR
jgi:hypothetical protein